MGRRLTKETFGGGCSFSPFWPWWLFHVYQDLPSCLSWMESLLSVDVQFIACPWYLNKAIEIVKIPLLNNCQELFSRAPFVRIRDKPGPKVASQESLSQIRLEFSVLSSVWVMGWGDGEDLAGSSTFTCKTAASTGLTSNSRASLWGNNTHYYVWNKQSDLYKAGNYIQCLAKTYKGKESEKYYIYTHTYIYIHTNFEVLEG